MKEIRRRKNIQVDSVTVKGEPQWYICYDTLGSYYLHRDGFIRSSCAIFEEGDVNSGGGFFATQEEAERALMLFENTYTLVWFIEASTGEPV